MKIFLFFSLLFTFLFTATAQQNPFDSLLAKKLKADDYGMKKYVLVILKTGISKMDKAKEDSLFSGHMQNIGRLAAEGKLVVAGPLGKNDFNYRGIFVLNTENIVDAKTMVGTDPAIKNNLLTAEYFEWYGSAAMQQVTNLHKSIQKKSF